MKRIWTILLVVLLVLATASVTFILTWNYATRLTPSISGEPIDQDPVNAKMKEIQSYLDTYYIDTYDPDAVAQGAADGAAAGMISSIGDVWSYYLTAEEMKVLAQEQSNSYVGIGIMISAIDEGLEVKSVTEGGPADQAGMRAGDILIGVDDKNIDEIGQDGAADLIKGEAGTDVLVRIIRDGEELELTVTRDVIVEDVVSGTMLEDGIGLVRIGNFNLHSAEQTFVCVNQLLQQGAEGIVFDVRFNPGGYKTEMVEILDNLLPDVVIFRSKDYLGQEEVVKSDRFCQKFPMVVVVNGSSVSAAEFFAAALQEYEAAEIVGSQTYGKGNYQVTFDLPDGSGLNLSVGKYFTPSGKSLTDVGVLPDVVVDLSREDYMDLYYGNLAYEDDEQLQTAVEVLRQKIS